MTQALAVLSWSFAWCCASIATASGWIAMRTGKAWAVGWMAAGALAAAGFVLIGLSLW